MKTLQSYGEVTSHTFVFFPHSSLFIIKVMYMDHIMNFLYNQSEDILLTLSVQLSKIHFCAISQQLLTTCQWNFLGTFNMAWKCAYHLHVRVGPFILGVMAPEYVNLQYNVPEFYYYWLLLYYYLMIVFILGQNYNWDNIFKIFKLNLTMTFKWYLHSRSNCWICLIV